MRGGHYDYIEGSGASAVVRNGKSYYALGTQWKEWGDGFILEGRWLPKLSRKWQIGNPVYFDGNER